MTSSAPRACLAVAGAALILGLAPAAAARGGAATLRIELPAAQAGERAAYRLEIASALAEVAGCFRDAGLAAPAGPLINKVRVFDGPPQAREYLSRTLGAPIEQIPESFAGTVQGREMFLISAGAYREVWRRTYPDWPWTGRSYHQLIVHELTHRAHEAYAIARHGSADAMGPGWFFEGFAVVCAGQFKDAAPPLGRGELSALVGEGRTPRASYPLYGRIVRALAARYGVKALVEAAAKPGFPDGLLAQEGAGRRAR